MSKLLINEYPLQVLPSLAVNLGLNEAIFIQQLHYWIENRKVAGKIADGRKWISNTIKAWREDNFPFWSEDTIQRVIKSLAKQGALLTRNDLNDNPFDRTTWYTIDYELLDRSPQVAVIPSPQLAPPDDRNLRSCTIYTETTVTENTREGPAVAPPPPHQAKFSKVCEIVGWDSKTLTKSDRGQLAQTVDALKEYSLEDLDRFVTDVWANDWRFVKNRSRPTLTQLRQEIGKLHATPIPESSLITHQTNGYTNHRGMSKVAASMAAVDQAFAMLEKAGVTYGES